VGNCLLNSLRLSINRRGGSSPLRFVERQDEGRARGCAPVPGQGIGAALRCLFTHPPGATNSTLPKNLHNSQGFKDIHGNLYVWRYIWEYVCVEERVSSLLMSTWSTFSWVARQNPSAVSETKTGDGKGSPLYRLNMWYMRWGDTKQAMRMVRRFAKKGTC